MDMPVCRCASAIGDLVWGRTAVWRTAVLRPSPSRCTHLATEYGTLCVPLCATHHRPAHFHHCRCRATRHAGMPRCAGSLRALTHCDACLPLPCEERTPALHLRLHAAAVDLKRPSDCGACSDTCTIAATIANGAMGRPGIHLTASSQRLWDSAAGVKQALEAPPASAFIVHYHITSRSLLSCSRISFDLLGRGWADFWRKG